MAHAIFMTNGELYHHGILGQKWGVRRYQNDDGTLTETGKKRYSVEYKRSGNTHIVDEEGKRMKGRDKRFMERQMKKDLKANDRQKYIEYKNAKKDSKTSYAAIGGGNSALLMASLMNSATESTRRNGQKIVDQMIAEYTNKYLDDLNK